MVQKELGPGSIRTEDDGPQRVVRSVPGEEEKIQSRMNRCGVSFERVDRKDFIWGKH